MPITCHGVLVPIGMGRRHDEMTGTFDAKMSRMLRDVGFFYGREFDFLGISFAYSPEPGTMAKPYYPKILTHPDGKSLSILVEARVSPARRRPTDEFASAAIAHVLDALIDYSSKVGWPYDGLARRRTRARGDATAFFFWGEELQFRVQRMLSDHRRPR